LPSLSFRRGSGERLLRGVLGLFFPHSVLSNTTGNLAYYPPSPFGEGRGEASEIPLQTVRYYCSQINSLSSKPVFVTSAVSIGYKEDCKRRPFALQNMPFYTSKDALLHCKRASFRTQKGVDGKAGRKEIDKKNGLPKPLRRRGCERKRWDMGGSLSLELQPPQAPPKEGMCLAG